MNAWYLAVAAWISVIFFSSTSLASQLCEQLFRSVSALFFARVAPTDPSYDVLHLMADKGLHVSMFLVLALLLWKAYSSKRGKVWLILLTGLIVGSCSEFLQRFFPGRDPAVRDVLINLGGTALGVCLVLCVSKLRARSDDRASQAA
jgi:VanZ family protein